MLNSFTRFCILALGLITLSLPLTTNLGTDLTPLERDQQRINDLSKLKWAIDLYLRDTGVSPYSEYPIDITLNRTSSTSNIFERLNAEGYLLGVPQDPLSHLGWYYGYRRSESDHYELFARLETDNFPANCDFRHSASQRACVYRVITSQNSNLVEFTQIEDAKQARFPPASLVYLDKISITAPYSQGINITQWSLDLGDNLGSPGDMSFGYFENFTLRDLTNGFESTKSWSEVFNNGGFKNLNILVPAGRTKIFQLLGKTSSVGFDQKELRSLSTIIYSPGLEPDVDFPLEGNKNFVGRCDNCDQIINQIKLVNTSVTAGEPLTVSAVLPRGITSSTDIQAFVYDRSLSVYYEEFCLSCDVSVGTTTDRTFRIGLPASLPGGQYIIRIDAYDRELDLELVREVEFSVIEKPFTNLGEVSRAIYCPPDRKIIGSRQSGNVYLISQCTKRLFKNPVDFLANGYHWKDVDYTLSDTQINDIKNGPPMNSYAGLLNFKNDHRIFYSLGDWLYWVPNKRAFDKGIYSWSNVKFINIPLSSAGKSLVKLVKTSNSEKIYYLTDAGYKRHIPNEQVFLSYNNNFSNVINVEPWFLDLYPDTVLISKTDDHKIYLLKNGKKYWVKTPSALKRLGLTNHPVAPVNAVELATYPEGPPIN